MKFIQGRDRFQICLFPVSLDDPIDQDNEVRVIDLLVDSLDTDALGFASDFVVHGRPAYHPKDPLKLFIHGYLNRTRSPRALEKETRRNIEVCGKITKAKEGFIYEAKTVRNIKDIPTE
jgi:transposase